MLGLGRKKGGKADWVSGGAGKGLSPTARGGGNVGHECPKIQRTNQGNSLSVQQGSRESGQLNGKGLLRDITG